MFMCASPYMCVLSCLCVLGEGGRGCAGCTCKHVHQYMGAKMGVGGGWRGFQLCMQTSKRLEERSYEKTDQLGQVVEDHFHLFPVIHEHGFILSLKHQAITAFTTASKKALKTPSIIRPHL